jgi:hypothetical protein
LKISICGKVKQIYLFVEFFWRNTYISCSKIVLRNITKIGQEPKEEKGVGKGKKREPDRKVNLISIIPTDISHGG